MGKQSGALAVTFTMVELPTTSTRQSGEFLQRLFGFQATDYGPTYTDLSMGNGQFLGLQADPDAALSVPLPVFQVDDLDAAQRMVVEAGGRITVEPFDFPGGRRFQFREPGGNELAIWASTEAPE